MLEVSWTYDQITLINQTKRRPKRIHPKAVLLHGISERDVSRNALIEAILAEDAEGSGQTSLQILALLVLVVEGRWAWELLHAALGNALLDTRLERCLARVDGLAVVGSDIFVAVAIYIGVGCHSYYWYSFLS